MHDTICTTCAALQVNDASESKRIPALKQNRPLVSCDTERNYPPGNSVRRGLSGELTGANELTRKQCSEVFAFLMRRGQANPAAKKPFNCHHLQALNQHAPDKLTAHILNVFTLNESPLSPSLPPTPSLSRSLSLPRMLFLSARHFDLKITLPTEISKSKACTLQSRRSLEVSLRLSLPLSFSR